MSQSKEGGAFGIFSNGSGDRRPLDEERNVSVEPALGMAANVYKRSTASRADGDRPGEAAASSGDDLDLAAERLLLERVRAGDERAFDELADRVTPALYRFAASRLRGDRELVRDIVQTTLCKAFGNLQSFRGEARFFTWLCSCCRNEIKMYFRALGRAPVGVELDEETVRRERLATPPERDPELEAVRTQEAARVHVALDLLPAHYATVLRAKYLEQLPVKEIAARLDLGPKATESLLTRARGAFRAAFAAVSAAEGAPGPRAGDGRCTDETETGRRGLAGEKERPRS